MFSKPFCVDLDVLDHCPAGRSNDDSFLVSLQRQRDLDLKWTLMRFSGPLEEEQPHSITDPPSYLTVGVRLSSAWSSFYSQPTSSVSGVDSVPYCRALYSDPDFRMEGLVIRGPFRTQHKGT